jgi:hypothetical protein
MPPKKSSGRKRTYRKRRYYRKRSYRLPAKRSYSRYTKAIANTRSQALLLVDPWLAAHKGVKIPDADSTASIALTITENFVLGMTNNTTGTITGYGAALRIYPVPWTKNDTLADGELTLAGFFNAADPIDWAATAVQSPQWIALDENVSRIRTVNYGVKLSYMGNRDTNRGLATVTLGHSGLTGAPFGPNDVVTMKKSFALGSLNCAVVGRKVSNQAYDYIDVDFSSPSLAEYSTLIENFETVNVFIEGADEDSKVLCELTWNIECLPLHGTLASAVASKPAYNNPKVVSMGHQLEHVIDPISSGGVVGGVMGMMYGGMVGMPTEGAILGGAIGSSIGRGFSNF